MDALVVIDMQRWMFRHPKRMAQVDSLVSNISQLVTAFQQADQPIYDVRTVHKANRSTWSRLMLKYDYPCLLEETSDIDAVDGYQSPRCAKRVIKTANSAFLRTNFERMLYEDGVDRLVLVGVFIKGCIGLTAADAAQRNFDVMLIDDAIGHTDAGSRETFFDWLIEDYELECLKTADFLATFGGGTERG